MGSLWTDACCSYNHLTPNIKVTRLIVECDSPHSDSLGWLMFRPVKNLLDSYSNSFLGRIRDKTVACLITCGGLALTNHRKRNLVKPYTQINTHKPVQYLPQADYENANYTVLEFDNNRCHICCLCSCRSVEFGPTQPVWHCSYIERLVCREGRDDLRKEDGVLTPSPCPSSVTVHGFLFSQRVVECVFLWTLLISFVFTTPCPLSAVSTVSLAVPQDVSAPLQYEQIYPTCSSVSLLMFSGGRGGECMNNNKVQSVQFLNGSL